jgi:hypothetical protein
MAILEFSFTFFEERTTLTAPKNAKILNKAIADFMVDIKYMERGSRLHPPSNVSSQGVAHVANF